MAPLISLGIFLVVVLGIMILVSLNIVRVPPSKVAVISGRRRQIVDPETGQTSIVGHRTISGGSAVRIPILERVDYLPLNVVSMPLTFQSVPADGEEGLVVNAIANVRIGADDQSLSKAIERLLGNNEAQIHQLVFATLDGHLRSILGSYSVEQVRSNPRRVEERLSREAELVLKAMGVVVDSFTVQRIRGSTTPSDTNIGRAVDPDTSASITNATKQD